MDYDDLIKLHGRVVNHLLDSFSVQKMMDEKIRFLESELNRYKIQFKSGTDGKALELANATIYAQCEEIKDLKRDIDAIKLGTRS